MSSARGIRDTPHAASDPAAIARHLAGARGPEELMRTGKYEYQSDFAKKYVALGREEGRESEPLECT